MKRFFLSLNKQQIHHTASPARNAGCFITAGLLSSKIEAPPKDGSRLLSGLVRFTRTPLVFWGPQKEKFFKPLRLSLLMSFGPLSLDGLGFDGRQNPVCQVISLSGAAAKRN